MPHLKPARWVGLLLLAVYLLTAGGQPFISDGEVMLITAMRIVDEHTVSLPAGAAIYPQTLRRADGVLFSKYGLGQPLAAAPLYAFGRYGLGQRLLGAAEPFYVGRYLALLLPAFATALTAGLLCAWATLIYCSARVGVALALLYGLGTLAWPYSRFFFSEPLFTACLALAALAIALRRPLLAGLAFGYALLTRVGGVVLLPALVGYLWLASLPEDKETGGQGDQHHSGLLVSLSPWHFRDQWAFFLQRCCWLALGLVPSLLMMAAYNWVRFRSLAERGYADEGFSGNLLAGLYGLLLSPGKSVFLYVPLLLALPWALPRFWRHHPREALLVGLLSAITLGQSALWWIWWAGWGWGPRFLVPLMPFLALALGVLLKARTESREPRTSAASSRQSAGGRHRTPPPAADCRLPTADRQSHHKLRLLVVGLLGLLSVGVNLLGILVDFNPYIIEVTGGDMAREAIYLYQPAYSPILAHLRRLDFAHLPIASFVLDAPQFGFPQPWAGLIAWGCVALLLLSAGQVWRSLFPGAQKIG